MITKKQLNYWKMLSDCATPAPWTFGDQPFEGLGHLIVLRNAFDGDNGLCSPDGICLVSIADAGLVPENWFSDIFPKLKNPDRAFLSQSREALPLLIDEVERLNQKLEWMSCEKQLPPSRQRVLLLVYPIYDSWSEITITIGEYLSLDDCEPAYEDEVKETAGFYAGSYRRGAENTLITDKVLCWMPLPDLPDWAK